MALPPGTRIGSFEIVGLLGAGGMGEVYRARDVKLKREVAIKSLPPLFASDPERLARFQREAEILASLSHPNIASIHELHEESGTPYLIMEVVEGETLADRIQSGALPFQETIDIAQQIAEGFEAAHAKGIIHRDLKPANIKITPDGRVKVLDFGLAKAFEAYPSAESLSHSPTMLTGPTAGGVIMGTAAYMSPEQARGRELTRQTDIWAFGCVLYEMLTGRSAFSGETVSDTIAKVLKEEPAWDAMDVRIRPVVQRCLEKDSRKRYRDIGDVLLDLSRDFTMTPAVIPNVATKRSRLPLIAGLFLLAAIAAAGILLQQPRPTTIPNWTGTILPGPPVAMAPRLSPDERLVAFLAMIEGTTQVAVMQPNSTDWQVLTDDRYNGGAGGLSWSADSTRIYYTRTSPAGSTLIFSVPAVGGSERRVGENASLADVLPDESLLVLRVDKDRQRTLQRFWPETGKIKPYPATVNTGANSAPVRAFQNGTQAVFWGRSLDQPQSDAGNHLYVVNLETSALNRVPLENSFVNPASTLALSPDGNGVLTISRAGDLSSVIHTPWTGSPTRTLFSTTTSIWDLTAAADGSIYLDQVFRPYDIVRVTERGEPEHLFTMSKPTELPYREVVLPLADGRMIVPGQSKLFIVKPGGQATAFVQTKEPTTAPMTMVGRNEVAFILGAGSTAKLAIANVSDGRIVRRLDKVEGGTVNNVTADRDGKTIYYASRGMIWAVASDGGDPRSIRPGDGVAVDPEGKYLIVQLNEEQTRLLRVPLNGDPERALSFPTVILAGFPLAPNAIRGDGRILASAITGWFFSAALLRPDTGQAELMPIPKSLDVFYVGWTHDDRVFCTCKQMHSAIWRFTPTK